MELRDHQPIIIEDFNGLYRRGDPESCPSDHSPDCENIQFPGSSGMQTRFGIGISGDIGIPTLTNIVRIYNYVTQTADTLLVLTDEGKIFHIINGGTTALGPILTIADMEDFALLTYAGRAYISPFATFGSGSDAQQKGLEDEFLYVYLGDGTPARKAAGATPAGTLTVGDGAAGHTDAGLHIFGVVGETDSGFLSAPCALAAFTTSANLSVSFSTIPLFTGTQWVKRHIVASIIIQDFNGDLEGYQLFFIPDATINDNTSTTLANISFYDADLLEDASHLQENFPEIPAGSNLSLYHDRLCLACTFDDPSIVLVSAQGEPEAIDQIDGLLIFPLDGTNINQTAELRDVLYGFKRTKTGSWTDNGDVPSSWPFQIVDYGIGSFVHGVATVVDSGATNVDYLIVASYKGIMVFNGRYALPELSWKVFDYWLEQDRDIFNEIQMLNDTVKQRIYCALPDKLLLVGEYQNGLDAKAIKWAPWRFDIQVTTIALVNISTLIIGSLRRLA